MRRAALVLVGLLWAVPAAGQDYYVGETRFLEWDYPAEALPTIVRFELQIGSGTWQKIGLALRRQLPALVPGAYIARVRACRVDVCSAPLALAFNVLPIEPPEPTTALPPVVALRVVPA